MFELIECFYSDENITMWGYHGDCPLVGDFFSITTGRNYWVSDVSFIETE